MNGWKDRVRLPKADERILEVLHERIGDHQTIGCLSKRLALSPEAVADSIRELQHQGYEIEMHPSLGYRLLTIPDRLLPVEIRRILTGQLMGRQIYSYRSVRSTNRVATEMVPYGPPEGTLVLAEEQLAGRGRLGRVWHSPPGLGLWMSLILYPRVPADRMFQLAICGALAVAETVLERFALPVKVKWPNDVLIRDAKLAGVLVETQLDSSEVPGVVLGIGFNVNHRDQDFPRSLRPRATSLRMELGRVVSRIELLGDLLAQFERIYLQFQTHGLEPFLGRWRQLSAVLGQPVSIQIGPRHLSGRAVDIDSQGALVLEEKSGRRQRFLAGDVSLSDVGTRDATSTDSPLPNGTLSEEKRSCGSP
jgi:BirA family biotin operon repressor/biotin-[acetyl-CoA-carboxylase] ligase